MTARATRSQTAQAAAAPARDLPGDYEMADITPNLAESSLCSSTAPLLQMDVDLQDAQVANTLPTHSILVVIDRYTKLAKYIPAKKTWTAEDLADAMVDVVFTQFGRPKSIVSDRGSLFTSNFWSAFCYHLWVRLGYSTAYHPQTDGQTERQNQTLETYLRSYVNYEQNDWAKWLSIAEFAYNNSAQGADLRRRGN